MQDELKDSVPAHSAHFDNNEFLTKQTSGSI